MVKGFLVFFLIKLATKYETTIFLYRKKVV